MRCPTPCDRCGEINEQSDMRRLPAGDGCGDLVCMECINEIEDLAQSRTLNNSPQDEGDR